MTEAWDPNFLERSPMFEPLRCYGAAFPVARWPTLEDLQVLLDQRSPTVSARSGRPLRFVEQERKTAVFERQYEARIYLKGEMQVRAANWHDLLNAMVWMTFPNAKAALNERHYRALVERRAIAAKDRGPVQDTMTLFDEGGVIVAASDSAVLRELRECRWKDLFWRNRARTMCQARFYLFGHALYEKALRPFTGITGRGILFDVTKEFLTAPLTAQLAQLDANLARHLSDMAHLKSTRELAPVPILGVPGWCTDNDAEAYYDNVAYFRPTRARSLEG